MQLTLDEQIERQRWRVEGPPEPRWVAAQGRDAALLRESLSVVEFGTVMQPVCLFHIVTTSAPTLLHGGLYPCQHQRCIRCPLARIV